MQLIPAIDLKDGKCVRLFQGDFDKQTDYSTDPLEVAQRFATFGTRDLHVVDLDGARTGSQCNAGAVRRIAEQTDFEIQLGGGIRSREVLVNWFNNGMSRGVIGSLAVAEPRTVKAWFNEFGAERLVLALDVSLDNAGTPFLSTHGWTTTSEVTLWECIDDYLADGLTHVLCTDISRDGALAGPNIQLYGEILKRYPGLQLQASGGVRDVNDLLALQEQGLPAAISGRALLDGAISADEVSSFRQSA